MLYEIIAPHFVVALKTHQGDKVCRAPPIIYYMLGWEIGKVSAYCKKKNWEFNQITTV